MCEGRPETSESSANLSDNENIDGQEQSQRSTSLFGGGRLPPEEVEEQLRDHFDDYFDPDQGQRIFAFHVPIEDAPNPGLQLVGHGPIAFPLDEDDINKIKLASMQIEALSHDASTVSTQSPKLVWEVSSQHWHTQNPAWEHVLRPAIKELKAAFDIETDAEVVAIPQKLLLFGPGSTVECKEIHTSTNSAFGTLDVALPSKHSQLDMEIAHDGVEASFSTANLSQYDISATAWYSTARLSSILVDSGHRLVLRYTLQEKSLPRLIRPPLARKEATDNLRALLGHWSSQPARISFKAIGYVLSEYQNAQDRLNLSGKDKNVVAELEEVCEQCGFYLYFADLERTTKTAYVDRSEQMSEYDSSGWVESYTRVELSPEATGEPVSTTFRAMNFVALDGVDYFNPVAVQLDEDWIFCQPEFEDDSPEEEQDIEEDNTDFCLRTYTHTIALIMPRSSRLEFFLKDDNDDTYLELFKHFQEQIESGHLQETLKDEIRQMCTIMLANDSWGIHVSYSEGEILMVLLEAVAFLDAVELLEYTLPLAFASPTAFAVVRRMIDARGHEWLLQKLEQQLAQIDGFSARIISLELIEEMHLDCISAEWIRRQYLSDLWLLKFDKSIDGKLFEVMAASWIKDEDFHATLHQMTKKHYSMEEDFILTTLAGITQTPTVPGELFKGLLQVGLHFLDPSRLDHDRLCQLLHQSVKLNLVAELEYAVARIVNKATTATHDEVDRYEEECLHKLNFGVYGVDMNEATGKCLELTFFKFLKCLSTLAVKDTAILNSKPIQTMYQQILNLLVVRCQRMKPTAPLDWVRNKLHCARSQRRPWPSRSTGGKRPRSQLSRSCLVCKVIGPSAFSAINDFLTSPTKKSFHVRTDFIGNMADVTGHLRRDLLGRNVDVDTRRSSNELVFVKDLTHHEQDMEKWRALRSRVASIMSSISGEQLKILLGPHFEAIMKVKPVPLEPLQIPKHPDPSIIQEEPPRKKRKRSGSSSSTSSSSSPE